MNEFEYKTEILSCAEEIAKEAMSQADNDLKAAQELISDGLLHETIDSHQWIIYTTFHTDVIRHSNNEDSYLDVCGPEDLGELIIDKGLDHIQMLQAFWAMHDDINDKIEAQLEEFSPHLI